MPPRDSAPASDSTLPWSWYTDPDVLAAERARIFRRAWQYVGRSAQVAEPQQFLTGVVADVPVVVVRDDDGDLSAFVNVCRHRGAEVVTAQDGRARTLRCPYHAWTYDLRGDLRSAPRADHEGDFDRSQLSLRPVPVAAWGPFLFANLDVDAAPLSHTLGDLPDRIAASGVDLGRLRFHHRAHYEQRCNWKVAVENYLECYHCAVAHPAFARVVDVRPDAYRLEASATFATQHGPPRDGRDAPGAVAGAVERAQYHLVYPSLKINIYPGQMNLSIGPVLPVATDATVGYLDYFFGDDVDEAWIATLLELDDQVGAEDVALVESVQRGVSAGVLAGVLDHGTLLPESEQLVHAFQRYLADQLSRRP